MPIEFRCVSCNYLLSTPDDSAGKKARCPGCGGIQDIPATQPPTTQFASEVAPLPGEPAPHAWTHSSPNHTSSSSPASPTIPGSNPFSHPPMLEPTDATSPINAGAAKSRLMAPAIILIVLHLLGLAVVTFAILAGIFTINNRGVEDGDLMTLGFLIFVGLFSLVSIAGCVAMLNRRFYLLAVSTAIVNLLASLLCAMLPLLPFSLWAAIVLFDAHVKSHFR